MPVQYYQRPWERVFPLEDRRKVGHYSVHNTSDGQVFHDSKDGLRVLTLPSNNMQSYFDLKDGFIGPGEGELPMGAMYESAYLNDFPFLQWIKRHRNVFRNRIDCPDFVAMNGLLEKLLVTPFKKEGWIICVSKFQGTHFMRDFWTEEQRQRELNPKPGEEVGTFAGHRFEFYASELVTEEWNDDYNRPNNYYCVLKSKIGHHSLCYSAETDCIRSRQHTGDRMTDYIELKTSHTNTFSDQNRWTPQTKFKMTRWWAQSHLAGIDTIICGYRDDEWIVTEIKKFAVDQVIPNRVQNRCLLFLNRFLDFVKHVVQEDDRKVMYEFRFSPEAGSRKRISAERRVCSPDRYVIPDWY